VVAALALVTFGVTCAAGIPAGARAAGSDLTWTVLQPTVPARGDVDLYGVAPISPTDVWAVGIAGSSRLILHWDGAAWSRATGVAALPGAVRAVSARASSDVWAVGHSSAPRARVLHYDGASWTSQSLPPLGDGTSTLRAVSAQPGASIWAVGRAGIAPLAMRLVDGVWRVTPLPNAVSGQLESVVAVAKGDVWAVGWRHPAGESWRYLPLAYRWNGSTWSRVSMPVRDYRLPSQCSVPLGVAGADRDHVWVAGYSEGDPGGDGGPRAEVWRWSGSAWRLAAVPTFHSSNMMRGVVAISADDVWAFGDTDYDGAMALHLQGNGWVGVDLPDVYTGPAGLDLLYGGGASGANDLWAVGAAAPSSGQSTALVLHGVEE